MGIAPCGLPHSEICGSTDICSLPQLIAACHVLLRLLVPRHPPCALHHLSFGLSFSPITSSLILARSCAYLSTRTSSRSNRSSYLTKNPTPIWLVLLSICFVTISRLLACVPEYARFVSLDMFLAYDQKSCANF